MLAKCVHEYQISQTWKLNTFYYTSQICLLGSHSLARLHVLRFDQPRLVALMLIRLINKTLIGDPKITISIIVNPINVANIDILSAKQQAERKRDDVNTCLCTAQRSSARSNEDGEAGTHVFHTPHRERRMECEFMTKNPVDLNDSLLSVRLCVSSFVFATMSKIFLLLLFKERNFPRWKGPQRSDERHFVARKTMCATWLRVQSVNCAMSWATYS